MAERNIEEACGLTATGRVRHLRWPRTDGTMTRIALCWASPLTPLLAGASEWRYPLCKKCERQERTHASQPKED